jgi:hypothetical protein
MKKILLIILVLIRLSDCNSQSICLNSISLDNTNLKILYYGVENGIEIVPDNIGLSIVSNGADISEHIKDSIRYFNIVPKKDPDLIDMLWLKVVRKKDFVAIDSICYKVRKLDCRGYQISFDKLDDYEYSNIQDLLSQDKIDVHLPCSHYIKGFSIFYCDFLFVTKKGYKEYRLKGNNISVEIKDAIRKLELNDKIIIWAYGEPYPYNSVMQRLDPLIINVGE